LLGSRETKTRGARGAIFQPRDIKLLGPTLWFDYGSVHKLCPRTIRFFGNSETPPPPFEIRLSQIVREAQKIPKIMSADISKNVSGCGPPLRKPAFELRKRCSMLPREHDFLVGKIGGSKFDTQK